MKPIVYLDNAATTALDPQVLEAMLPFMSTHYGNPSSVYSIGRESRMAIEQARKQVASYLDVKSTTIFFTSGGTESNNTAIAAAVTTLGCSHIITSPTEHHAVLHTVAHQVATSGVSSSFVKVNEMGEINLADLELQLAEKTLSGVKCLISLMHANNEIGALLDIAAVGALAKRYGAIFHSDCVQTIGHYPINLEACGVHFASASGHKFHGPKGTGILYVSEGTQFSSFIHGGGQERKKRAGTENVHGIIGFAKALSLTMENHEEESQYITMLRNRLKDGLIKMSDDFSFNSTDASLYTVLSVNFPAGTNTDLILALLDREGICASGGSACSSGDDAGSHVITALNKTINGATIRFSFSRMTSIEDIDFALQTLAGILKLNQPELIA